MSVEISKNVDTKLAGYFLLYSTNNLPSCRIKLMNSGNQFQRIYEIIDMSLLARLPVQYA